MTAKRPCQIVKALEEWRDGRYKSLDLPNDLKLAGYFDSIQAKAHKWFSSIKSADIDLWLATSHAIHSNPCLQDCSIIDSWVPRGVPCIPSP
jgi:hypothetical protein